MWNEWTCLISSCRLQTSCLKRWITIWGSISSFTMTCIMHDARTRAKLFDAYIRLYEPKRIAYIRPQFDNARLLIHLAYQNCTMLETIATLSAKRHVEIDSSICAKAPLIFAIMTVRQFPPRLSLNTDVIMEFR